MLIQCLSRLAGWFSRISLTLPPVGLFQQASYHRLLEGVDEDNPKDPNKKTLPFRWGMLMKIGMWVFRHGTPWEKRMFVQALTAYSMTLRPGEAVKNKSIKEGVHRELDPPPPFA